MIANLPWYPFAVVFENDEGKFQFTVYATNFEHAKLIVQDIRETATLAGQIVHTERL